MSTVGLVLASHGPLAQGLREAAEMIAGPQDAVAVVALSPAENLDEYQEKLRAAVEQVDRGNGALILVDLFGGSPGNTAAYLLGPNVEAVTGVNLAMLLEVLGQRGSQALDVLAGTAVAAARDGAIRLAEALRG